MRGLYFSKEVIPFTGKTYADDEPTPVFHHVGVYAYRPAALAAYPPWPVGPLETAGGAGAVALSGTGRARCCVSRWQARGRQFWELNNPSDVPIIEAMMAATRMICRHKPRFLGGFALTFGGLTWTR